MVHRYVIQIASRPRPPPTTAPRRSVAAVSPRTFASMSKLMKSGIGPLDERLGGLVPGRPYVLSGAPGTGKSVACLEFLHAALDEGGVAALLTHDDPSDLLAQGEYLGLDLTAALAEERLVVVRYQLDFARRFARTADPAVAFDELLRLIGERRPERIAIDSISPIVEAGTASGVCVAALLDFLERLGATSLITHSGDLGGRFDRRLEPLTQRAAAILHMSAERDRTGTLEIQKVRFAVTSTAPISFVIRPGLGIVAASESPTRRAGDVPVETRRKVLVLTERDVFPPELLHALRSRFDVAVRERTERGFDQLAQSALGAVLVHVRRDSIADALALVRDLRRGGSRSPIAFVTAFTLRSSDRARALRAGADDFFVALHADEFLLRVESLIQRGRSNATASPEPVLVTPPPGNGSGVLEESEFRDMVQSQMGADTFAFFTLVRLSLAAGTASGADELASLARRQIRREGGDLVGRVDGGVTVLLYSARRKDVAPFVHRVREAVRGAGHGEMEVAVAAYPSEEAEVQALLGALHA